MGGGGHTCNSARFMTLVLPCPSAGSTTYVPFSNWSTTLCTLVLHRSWILFLPRMVLSLTSTLLCLSYFCFRIAASCQFLSSSSCCTSQFLLMSGDPGTWFLTLCLVQLNQSVNWQPGVSSKNQIEWGITSCCMWCCIVSITEFFQVFRPPPLLNR